MFPEHNQIFQRLVEENGGNKRKARQEMRRRQRKKEKAMQEGKAHQEAIFNGLVKQAMDALDIDRDQAEKRVRAVLNSDIMKNGNPQDPATQKAIDKIMQTPVK